MATQSYPEGRVLIIMTGGTICMKSSPEGLVPARGFLKEGMATRPSFNDGSNPGERVFHLVEFCYTITITRAMDAHNPNSKPWASSLMEGALIATCESTLTSIWLSNPSWYIEMQLMWTMAWKHSISTCSWIEKHLGLKNHLLVKFGFGQSLKTAQKSRLTRLWHPFHSVVHCVIGLVLDSSAFYVSII